MLQMVIFSIRLAALVFALWGLEDWVNKRINLFEFSLPVTFAGIGSCMFIAGILNILVETALLITGFGFWCGFSAVRNKRKIRAGLSFHIWMAVFTAFLIGLYGYRVNVYDDFSHWSLTLSQMIETNRFPSFLDQNIGFTSYQIGNLSFLYYIVLISGIQAEWFWFFGHAVLIYTMLLPVFAFFKKPFACIAVNFILLLPVYLNGGIGTLVVDTLLPFVMLAGLAVCIYYRENLLPRFWMVTVFAVFLVSVKTTGVLYAAILMAYALYCIRPWSSKLLTAAVCPFAVYYLWLRHVKLVFANGLNSRHAVSLSWFASVLHGKSLMDIVKLTAKMALRFFSPSNLFILLVVFWLVTEHFAKKKGRVKTKLDWEIDILIAGSTVIYEIGLWAMYVFSMPQVDAAILSSYERYYMTQMLVVIGLALIRFRYLLDGNPFSKIERGMSKPVIAGSVCLLFILHLGTIVFLIKPSINQMFPAQIRISAEQLIEDELIPPGKRYLLISDIVDYGYRYNMMIYLLNPMKLKQVSLDEFAAMEAPEQEFDYLLFLYEDGTSSAAQLNMP